MKRSTLINSNFFFVYTQMWNEINDTMFSKWATTKLIRDYIK